MSNLMKIHALLKKLQEQNPNYNVQFILYDDWSGSFCYVDYKSHKIPVTVELKPFNSFSELENIINEQA